MILYQLSSFILYYIIILYYIYATDHYYTGVILHLIIHSILHPFFYTTSILYTTYMLHITSTQSSCIPLPTQVVFGI
jgi:hypothetical protein